MTYALDPGLVDDPMFPVLGHLAACVRTELTASKGGSLCFTGLMVGSRAGALGFANCGESKSCGVAWVRLNGMFPSESFPQPDDLASPSSCQSPLAYEVEIGVARCAPRAPGKQMYPDEQDTFNALRLYMSDARATKKALLCCLKDAVKTAGLPDIQVALGNWSPLEEGAGLSGGMWQGWVGRA